MDMYEMYEIGRRRRIINIVVLGSLFTIAIILTYLIKIRNKKVKLEPKRQKIVDKTISEEEYVTSYIKNLIKEQYPENYDTILGKLKNKNWFTTSDIQNIAVKVKEMDDESVIDEFLFALSIEYIGEEIYNLARRQPRFPARDWNIIINRLKNEHKVKVEVDFNISDI